MRKAAPQPSLPTAHSRIAARVSPSDAHRSLVNESSAARGKPELTIISLGGGVQSSVLALMAAEGAIKPMPDYAVFADTGWEPDGVYRHLEWLSERLPFPVRRVSRSNIREDILSGTNSTGQAFSSIPVYVRSLDGKTGIARRQCTREYKLAPIEAEVRDLLGLGFREQTPKGMFVELWIGISRDEIIRMKPSRQPWMEHRWPLVDMGFTRDDCKAWFGERYPSRTLPRSACIGCPYHTDAEWTEMRRDDPVAWEDAVLVDNALRSTERAKKFDGEMYLHNSMTPLGEVEFSAGAERAAAFGEECEGMCGV